MIRKILQSGNPILRKKSKPVIKFDKKILSLIQDLKDTLATQKDPEGVGLAAPQLGKNLRVFVCSYKKFNRVVINPEIIEISKSPHSAKALRGKKEIMEGCLSLPNYYGPLKRSQKIKIKYLDGNGKEVIEIFTDFEAQIILHEIDHLEGILFMDRIFEQKESLYKLTGKDWEEVELA